ncbi:MAG: hypothetical protein WBQ95_17615 [Terracidiphilus sp.]
MKNKTASTTETPNPGTDQLQAAVTATVGTADAGGSQSIQNLTLLHSARLSQLKRTAATLKQQYGASDPNVTAAEAAVKAGSARVAQMAALHQQASTPAPLVSTPGWALQGRVFSSTLQPVQNLTVFLVDASKTFQQEYGFAYTDSSGYFLLSFEGTKDSHASAPQLYIEIANASGKPIYLGTDVFSPAAGSTTYQNITLPAGEHPIGNPPSAIRGSAIPAAKKKSQA